MSSNPYHWYHRVFQDGVKTDTIEPIKWYRKTQTNRFLLINRYKDPHADISRSYR